MLPLGAFVLLTAGNAFFVAAEFSLVTVDRAWIEQQAAAGDRGAGAVLAALRTLSFQLSGAQLGITITALLTGYLAEPAIARLLRPLFDPLAGGAAAGVASGVALALATLISMLFGELVPKNAALARPMPIARATAPGQRAFSAVFGWLIKGLNGSANWLVRRLGVEPQEELASARSPEELGLLAAISARAGALPRDTALLLQRTIRFGDKRAAEAMTPRVDMVALPAEATVADLLAAARESGHSRFPVYADTLDQIVAVASVIDALAVPPAQRDAVLVRRIGRDPLFVPEHLDLERLLARLREAGTDLAVVVDEYGGTDGLVTTEDLVEELVGEIADEHDVAEHAAAENGYADRELPSPAQEAATPQARLAAGVLRGDEVAEQVGFVLPDGPYETLAGFLMAQLGHIPVPGETVSYEGWQFTVVEVERRRIEQVRVQPPPAWEPPGGFMPSAEAAPDDRDTAEADR